MTTYEDEVRDALQKELATGVLHEVGDSATFFKSLSKVFPTDGSKVDWSLVPNAIERFEPIANLQPRRCIEFFDEIRSKYSLGTAARYAGDSALEFVLEGSIDAIRSALPTLLRVPQHHYIVGAHCAWCFCFSMEGDMSFGEMP